MFPPVCGLCGKPADSDDRLVCNKCWETIRGFEAPYCSGCRELLYETLRCSDCRPQPMIIFSLGYFDSHLQTILHDLKYRGLKPLAASLGERLADLILPRQENLKIDLILPVPLHDSRQYRRGFNQSEEIARAIAERLNIPMAANILYSTRKTRQQAKLPAHRREANVRGAFGVDDDAGLIKGKSILLVDDVTTTGATLRENRRILKAALAGKIVAAVAATAL